jgi:hypothetical protein
MVTGISGTSRARLGVVGLLASIVLLLGAGSAHASSIFFLRDYNIWVANPDGSDAQQVTTDGTASDPYDFVSSAKTGTAPPIGFHRGGNSASEFGTMNPNGTDETVNPYNSNMTVDSQFFTRLDDAGDRMTWASKSDTSSTDYYAGVVGTNGSSPAVISNNLSMDARDVTFGDTAGDTLLFTDTGGHYNIGGDDNPPCDGTDYYLDILVVQTYGSNPTAFYCENDTFLQEPALSPNGEVIAATAESGAANSNTQIVTIPISGAVTNDTDQSPMTQITPANSGDTLPDFSPDGSEIVFQGPNDTIYTVPTSGGTPTEILTNADVPAWSPYTLASSGGGSGGGGSGGGGGGAGSGAPKSSVASVAVSGETASVSLSCTAGSGSCVDQLALDVTETVSGSKAVAVAARKHKRKHKLVVVGKLTVTLSPGQSSVVRITLNGKGKALVSKFGHLPATLIVTQGTTTIKTVTVMFRKHKRKKHKH